VARGSFLWVHGKVFFVGIGAGGNKESMIIQRSTPPNRRPRFAFAMSCRFDYCYCVPPSLSAAVGEPERWARYRNDG